MNPALCDSATVTSAPKAAWPVAEMTRRMKRGDEEAFEQFYDIYCDRLYRYLLVLTRGQEDAAREALQLALINAARSIKPLPDEEALWRWLTRLARHRFLDLVRKQKRRPVLVSWAFDGGLQEWPAAPPSDASPEALLENQLQECLAELDADDRELLEHFYFRGSSHQDLAQARQTTMKAIASKMARLREKLRASMLRKLHHESP
jgi:RNA polymerase sigma-70 factor (ECF subfamily)